MNKLKVNGMHDLVERLRRLIVFNNGSDKMKLFFRMPIQAPNWTEYLSCPVCCHEFAANLRPPISLGCGHTICRTCLATLHRKQCPFDQVSICRKSTNLLPFSSNIEHEHGRRNGQNLLPIFCYINVLYIRD